jgi:bifunctional non-homologous end joining protein LigD
MRPRTSRTLPDVQPIILTPRTDPFDDLDWFFEPKCDGFRGLLYVTRKGCYIRSKRGNHLKRFDQLCHWVRDELRVREVILDGEVVALDAHGRPNFRDLLAGRGDLLAASTVRRWAEPLNRRLNSC